MYWKSVSFCERYLKKLMEEENIPFMITNDDQMRGTILKAYEVVYTKMLTLNDSNIDAIFNGILSYSIMVY